MLAGELTLREDKQAGAKVKELSAQGVLHSCVSIDLEYGYHGRECTQILLIEQAWGLRLEHLATRGHADHERAGSHDKATMVGQTRWYGARACLLFACLLVRSGGRDAFHHRA